MLDAKIKNKRIVNQSDISGFINKSDLNKKIEALPAKAELKAVQDKIVKLHTLDLCYFLGKSFLGDNGFQNMLYVTFLSDYVIGWKLRVFFYLNFFHYMVLSYLT